jgi:hypothetical protein
LQAIQRPRDNKPAVCAALLADARCPRFACVASNSLTHLNIYMDSSSLRPTNSKAIPTFQVSGLVLAFSFQKKL